MGATSLLKVAELFFEVLALLVGSRLKKHAPRNATATTAISDFFTMITPSVCRGLRLYFWLLLPAAFAAVSAFAGFGKTMSAHPIIISS